MNVGAGNSIDNPLAMIEYLIATSAKDYATHKRDFMLYGIVCGWEGISHDKYPLNEECANELDKMHEQYEALKKMFDEGAKPVVHAHWMRYEVDVAEHPWHCSHCGWPPPKHVCHIEDMEYCSHCGACMDEKDGEKDG